MSLIYDRSRYAEVVGSIPTRSNFNDVRCAKSRTGVGCEIAHGRLAPPIHPRLKYLEGVLNSFFRSEMRKHPCVEFADKFIEYAIVFGELNCIPAYALPFLQQ